MIEKLQFLALMFVNEAKKERGERGATAVEYGLMVALIAAAIVTTVGLLGDQLNTLFTTITGDITL